MPLYARLRAWLRLRRSRSPTESPQSRPRVCVVVEGPHDIEFLRRISATLHTSDGRLPDLWAMERRGELVFVPFGGGDLRLWTHRLAGLGIPEFHLYDRESPPETELRREAAEVVNRRPGCLAVLTRKRSLENYLTPDVIREALGIEVAFTDDDPVADLVAQHCYARTAQEPAWEDLPRRAKQRRRNRAKRALNTKAAERMTPQRIAQSDPGGEIAGWLLSIARMAAQRR